MGGILAFFGTKGGLILLGVCVCLISLAVIARNWSCRKTFWDRRQERREERQHRSVECQLIAVVDGATVEVSWGPFGRQSRVVRLDGIEIPPSVADQARDHLRELTSRGSVRVEYEARGLLASETEEQPDSMEATAIVGVVYGNGGQCCNVEQLIAGLAKCSADADDVLKAAEKAAKKAKKGVWK